MVGFENSLKEVSSENYFVLKNGILIKSLPELSSVLESVDEDVFRYHVNSEKNDFADWIGNSIGDENFSNQIRDVNSRGEFVSALNNRFQEINNPLLFTNEIPSQDESVSLSDNLNLVMAETSSETEETIPDVPPDVPPDIPPDTAAAIDNSTEVPNKETSEVLEEMPQDKSTDEKEEPKEELIVTQEVPEQETKEEPKKEEIIQESVQEVVEEKPVETNNTKENDVEKKKSEAIEIREIETSALGVKEIDSLFKQGVPKICNMLFVGTMSTGKTLSALDLVLAAAKRGEKAMYISFLDSEEKIINIMKNLDKDVLNYLNSGNIQVKKLDTFEIITVCNQKKTEMMRGQNTTDLNLESTLSFVEIYNPNLVIVDSLSALDLGFSEDKMCYRHYVDRMFKYFEKLGMRSVFIKELVMDEDLHKEFYENILADCILYFKQDKKGKAKITVVKEYPLMQNKKKKHLFSLF